MPLALTHTARMKRFVDVARIQAAIEDAERRTSGEIRVSLAPFFWGSVRRAAEMAFVRLGMHRTRARNGVLVFVVPSRRALVVLGDSAVHASVGQRFWDDLVHTITGRFRRGEFTEGLVEGVRRLGEELARHYPYDPASDENELPNAVDVPDEPGSGPAGGV
jgi:uncharacterized membrane protein